MAKPEVIWHAKICGSKRERVRTGERERVSRREREKERERVRELGALCAGSVSFLVLCESCCFFYMIYFFWVCVCVESNCTVLWFALVCD